jgi:hypothetical protein
MVHGRHQSDGNTAPNVQSVIHGTIRSTLARRRRHECKITFHSYQPILPYREGFFKLAVATNRPRAVTSPEHCPTAASGPEYVEAAATQTPTFPRYFERKPALAVRRSGAEWVETSLSYARSWIYDGTAHPTGSQVSWTHDTGVLSP